MAWLGLDIGGANLKIADGEGFASSRNFALWKNPDKLATTLRSLIAESPPADHLAATMTGELADCYETREHGVREILNALTQAADGRHTRIYLTNGKLVTPEVARRQPLRAAASNWHALASFVARSVTEGNRALLLDVGSTTTDLIPLDSNGPLARGTTDLERLVHNEMLYTGVRRSPVCGVVRKVPYRDAMVSLAQEVFATMHDVYLILGEMVELPASVETADGRPATKSYARQRISRMICADSESFHHRDAVRIAQAAAEAQVQQIADAFRTVTTALPVDVIMICGEGEFLSRRILKELNWTEASVQLHSILGAKVTQCAPAHAVAVLAREAAEG